MYQYGLGIPPDYGKALAWYRTAAEHGNQTASRNLALLTAQLRMDSAEWTAANTASQRDASEQRARRARIAELQREVSELEWQAEQEENLCADAGQTKNGGLKLQADAEQYRAEATRLRAQLASLDAGPMVSMPTIASIPAKQ
jgi:hypothetical protein